LPPSKNGADALIATGDEQRAVVPAGGLVVVYGDAGAGKTTLLLDWALHFAAGRPWLDLLSPVRALSVLLIKNEGSRPEFRRKLRDRLAAWDGPNPGGRLRVLVEPWAAVTLRNEGHRASSPACATSSGST
jgi:AAA domain